MDTAAAAEDGGAAVMNRHIKKRALRNKSLSVSFDEKDLKCVFSIHFIFFLYEETIYQLMIVIIRCLISILDSV